MFDSRHTFAILVLAFAVARPALAEAQEAQAKLLQEYYQSFKGLMDRPPGWEFYGAEAQAHVKFEPEGMRITLPAGYPGERSSVGIRNRLAIQGDLELTVGYEILQEPDTPPAASMIGTRCTMDVVFVGPRYNAVTLSRRVWPKAGPQYYPWMRTWNETTDKPLTIGDRGFDTTASAGQLRVARAGSEISYLASAGTGFELVRKLAFSMEDAQEIRFVATTREPEAFLDVRLLDFRVRATALPGMVPAAQNGDTAASPGLAPRSGGGLAVGLLIVLLLAAALATLLYVRRHREAS